MSLSIAMIIDLTLHAEPFEVLSTYKGAIMIHILNCIAYHETFNPVFDFMCYLLFSFR